MSKKNFKGGFDALLGDNNDLEKELKEKIKSDKKGVEIRATFLVDSKQQEKIKAIAYWERKMLKTVLYEALENYINSYESSKGKIMLPREYP